MCVVCLFVGVVFPCGKVVYVCVSVLLYEVMYACMIYLCVVYVYLLCVHLYCESRFNTNTHTHVQCCAIQCVHMLNYVHVWYL